MKKWIPLLSLLMISALAVTAAGCGPKKEAGPVGGTVPAATAANDKLQVEASFYPMYEFTRQVAGDLADVHLLIPSGVEPHDWEPTPQDIAKIAKADVLVYNGAGMEGWVDQVAKGSDNANLSLVEASKGLELMEGVDEEEEHADAKDHEGHDHGSLDPHVWLSPKLAIEEVRSIEKALVAKAPQHQAEFTKNADAYVAKLEQLDADYQKELAGTKRKDFVTQHAAFGYLAHTYGLTQVPIAGLSPEQEPSAAAMTDVIKFAKEHQVKTIFFETLVSSSVADTIAKEVGAKTDVLNPLEGLTQEEQDNHQDYIAIMRFNLDALKKALEE